MSLFSSSDGTIGSELHETIQQCEDFEMTGALDALCGECSSSLEFLRLVDDPIVTSVVPLEDDVPIEDVPTLVLAAGCGSLAAVQFLLGAQCDPNARSSLSRTAALHMAACTWGLDIVGVLVRYVLLIALPCP
jgi:hypothetical protein